MGYLIVKSFGRYVTGKFAITDSNGIFFGACGRCAKKDNGHTPYYLHLRGYGERNQGMVQDHQYCRHTVKRAGIV